MNLLVLGRQPELSLAELVSLYGKAARPFGPNCALVDSEVDLDKLGGSLKVVRLIRHFDQPLDLSQLPQLLAELPALQERLRAGKTVIGLSVYGTKADKRRLLSLGLDLKRLLKVSGHPVRVVPSEAGGTSAAQVIHNRLLDHGLDLVVATDHTGWMVGITKAVQDIESYGQRDFGRPGRSARLGMLPPKLAQIMINLAAPAANGLVLDPFCGTGVVPMEALLMGYNTVGADIDAGVLKLAEQNLSWLRQTYQPPGHSRLMTADARQLRLGVLADALVSEGYLGPALPTAPPVSQLPKLARDAAELTVSSLNNLRHSLKPGAGVCLCLPAWRTDHGLTRVDIVDQVERLGYTLRRFESISQPLIYARPGQIVNRELITLTKD